VHPFGYLADVLARVQDHPASGIDELLRGSLLDLSLQWGKTSTLTARFRGHAHHIVLTVLDVKLLHCPHESPWGPSVSVNDVRSTAGSGTGLYRIAIEIQSGDTILVEGNAVEWAVERDTA
jgi:hypothetical protein